MLRMFKIFFREKRYKDQMKVCARVPGVIYKFENQSLVTFEGNLIFMGVFRKFIYVSDILLFNIHISSWA